jgi:hypothetical protein
MKHRGVLELEIGGKTRQLKFSMNFWAMFTDNLGIQLHELGSVFEKGFGLSDIIKIVYFGLKAADLPQGKEIDYNEFTVGDWMDEFKPEHLTEIVEAMGNSKILGNEMNMGISRNVKKSSSQSKEATA